MTVQLNPGRTLAALSLTPLIDVVFLLLIFFLVTSRLSQEDREIDIPLPSAANAMPMTAEPQEMIVNIDESGQIIVNQRKLNVDEFRNVLRQSLADNPTNQAVFIRSHKGVPLQVPVNVMDICLELGADYSLSISGDDAE